MFAAYLAACGGGGGGGGDECQGDSCVNECELGTHDCDSNATCTDTDESYTCECNDGFEGDGQSCADVDECGEGLAECGGVSSCQNSAGSYECLCPDSLISYGDQCVALSSGTFHSCLIRDGALSCWGGNYDGQLGQGDNVSRGSPTAVGEAADWIAVDAGESGTCAIRASGALYCWGYDPIASDRLEPVQIGSDEDWARVAVGYEHFCAIKTDGRLYCWGYDGYGQLGNGAEDTSDHELPQQIGSDTTWVDVMATIDASCAIAADGSLYCWGEDGNGQLGNGNESTDTAHSPQAVPGLEDVALITAGDQVESTCAIDASGGLYCWSYNNDGQLGTGELTTVHSPTLVGEGMSRVAISNSACAIDDGGSLHCWGDNEYGQRGAGDRDPSIVTPTEVEDDRTWIEVAAGNRFMCGLADAGNGVATPFCWGSNDGGALGQGALDTYLEPTQLSGAWKWVAAGSNHTCAINTDDSLWCWGSNASDALGVNSSESSEQVPQAVSPTKSWQVVEAGGGHNCAIDDNNALYCWGGNSTGALGAGDTDPRTTPVQVGTGTDWSRVSAGGSSTCGLRGTPRSLYCWGGNSDGQLGTGDQNGRLSPVNVGDISQDGDEIWETISLGNRHTCASVEEPTQAGTQFALYCWGVNFNGEVGNGSNGDRVLQPDRIDVDQEWQISSGDGHTCGINDSNQLMCWGQNNYGQLGVGDTNERDVPTQSSEIASWTAVSTGSGHSCGLAPVAGGTGLFCTGLNGFGQLGLGSQDNQNVPARVGTATDWTQVSVGGRHSCAINSANLLYCWGADHYGQIGRGTAFSTEPTEVDQ